MSGNWLPSWGSANTTSAPELLANKTLALPPKTEPHSVELASLEPPKPEKVIATPDNTPDNAAKGHGAESLEVLDKQETRPKTSRVRHKASTSSLVSANTSNWLRWGGKQAANGQSIGKDGKDGESGENGGRIGNLGVEDGDAAGDNNEQDEPTDNNNDEDEDDDYSPQDNGDEIDDHVARGRKKTWSFWNGSAGPEDSTAKKEKVHERAASITNTILKSTPAIPARDDSRSDSKNRDEQASGKVDAENVDSDNGDDDAVLYKPHDSAKQFSKINTHKNENLRENVIVPDWNSCLHLQRLDSNTATSQQAGLAVNRNQPFDIKNWRNYLSHLSSRFGFGSNMQSDPDSDQSPVEKELTTLYERSYRLYGRALSKLPFYKRACLPNFSLMYTKSSIGGAKRQKTQLEEDAEDENSVSITNDAMGNLLINHRNRRSTAPSVTQSDIVNQKVGPLVKIRKILIIGVHGFFPTKMIRPLIGAPKGTSLKFANEAEKAVIRYCIENDLIDERETHNVSIQKIALEKEGKIFDRVDFFLEIMTKWAHELNDADFIFIASHSQGCVVSIILFARLIQLGILKNPLQKRIGLLGMAGVNNGPFYGIDKSFFMKAYSAIEHDSLMELFELTKFDSAQSLAYKESVQIIVNANVKICFIGSINDQLVPLYSALAAHVFHPNIYRACYIDHSSRTPDFIKRLVSICCQLQNLGYFDNNVIKELSAVLAGPLTGGGHSKIYNDGKVYDLGLKFALDTDDLVIPRASIGPEIADANGNYDELVEMPATNQVYFKEYNIGKIGTNPFVLPWCLRGLIFNIEKNWLQVQPHIMIDHNALPYKTGTEEIDSLYELFDKWKPDTKPLKELKFRLNGIRASKL